MFAQQSAHAVSCDDFDPTFNKIFELLKWFRIQILYINDCVNETCRYKAWILNILILIKLYAVQRWVWKYEKYINKYIKLYILYWSSSSSTKVVCTESADSIEINICRKVCPQESSIIH